MVNTALESRVCDLHFVDYTHQFWVAFPRYESVWDGQYLEAWWVSQSADRFGKSSFTRSIPPIFAYHVVKYNFTSCLSTGVVTFSVFFGCL